MKLQLLAVLLLPGVLAGCSSCQINTVPQGATIYLDGEQVGTSPCTVTVGGLFTSSHSLKAEKQGYHTGHKTVQQAYSVWKGSYWPTEQTLVLREKKPVAPLPAQPATPPPAAPAQPIKQPQPAAEGVACTKCNAAMGSARFCPDCGTERPAPQKKAFCTGCGAELGKGKFCSGCGAKR